MATATFKSPYSSALPFVSQASIATWLPEYDAYRTAAYGLYDDFYFNSLDSSSTLIRGTDDKPVLVPTAKRLIKTLSRYIGRNWGFSIRQAPNVGAEVAPTLDDATREELAGILSALWVRENLEQKFTTGKRSMLRRGDWIWYVHADPLKPPGSRISIDVIDPSTFFVILSEEDPTNVTGVQIVEQFTLDDGETVVAKVQRWLKTSHPEHPAYTEEGEPASRDIAYDVLAWEPEAWYAPEDRKAVSVPWQAALEVIPGITALPLYHIKNDPAEGDPYGHSELSGAESILAAINQGISDEDLALAISGLGMFWTDSGAPVDAEGNATDWVLGPQRVIEIGNGNKFARVDGITSVKPSQEHVAYLEGSAFGTSGVNDVALGKTSGNTKSGIALAIEMQPLFDYADEKDAVINGVLSQMFHDLVTMWLPTYEGGEWPGAAVLSVSESGDRLPFDREARFKELTEGYLSGILPLGYVLRKLREEFGYDFTEDEVKAALAAKANTDATSADPYADRVTQESADGDAQTT